MRILLVGGGSGGHVTPLLAVAGELVRLKPQPKLYLLTDKDYADTAVKLFENQVGLEDTSTIFAGKLRRYANKPLWWYLRHFSVILLNIRDIFFVLIGLMQSILLLHKVKPNVIFCKGGFVCLPVGLAARILKVPVVLHDSDTVPGLTVGVLSRWSRAIAVGADPSLYKYPKQLMYYTGIPIDSKFKPVSLKQQVKLKQSFEFGDKKPLLLVIGGGTGAASLNNIVAHQAKSLLKTFEVVHFTGKGKTEGVNQIISEQIVGEAELKNYHVYNFTNRMYKYLQAADLIISRAGATAIQEIATVGKPLVLVPGRQLTGGHQVKNAQVLAENQAAEVLNEDDLELNGELLVKQAVEVLKPEVSAKLVSNIRKFKMPRAACEIANLIVSSASYSNK